MDEVDAQKAKLIGGLMEAANSLRNAANFADGFANLLKHSPGGAPVNINPAALANVLGDAANQIHTTAPEVKRGRKKKDAVPEGAEGEEGGKKKRKRGEKKEKVPRDPNAPKRPPSAYLLFQNEVRKEMMTKFPSMTYREVLAEISKVWTAMSEDDKAIYNKATSAAKEKFLENKAAYDLSLTNINPNGEPAAASSSAAVAPAALPAPAAKPASKRKESVVAAAAAPPKVAAVSKQPVVPPVPEVTSDDSSSEDGSEDDDDESSSEEEEDDEEDERPAQKKGKAAQKEEPKAKAQPSRPPPSKGKVVKDIVATTSEKDKKKKAKAA